MPHYLGIDGGGTKTASVILDQAKKELGRGIGGPCNIATCDDATLNASVTEATESALKSAGIPMDSRFAGACAGVAGYTAKRRRVEFARIFAESVPADLHRVEPDYVIAYWGATEGEPGIIVIAGTGSVAYGRNAGGESHRVDGRGYLFGDLGSAYSVGSGGLLSIMQAADRGERPDEFVQKLLKEIAGEDADDVVEWVYRGFSPARVAELARPIAMWADKGDPQADHLLRQVAGALAGKVTMLEQVLNLPIPGTPIYRMGGLWQASPIIGEHFLGLLRTWHDHLEGADSIESAEPRHDAAYGAALLAISSRA